MAAAPASASASATTVAASGPDISMLVAPSLRSIMANLNSYATPDITALSAIPYLHCDNTAMTESSVQTALAYVTTMPGAGANVPSVCTYARDLMVKQILSSIQLTDLTQGNGDAVASDIKNAFYKAARDATAYYMRIKMNTEGGFSNQLTPSDEKVIQQWFDDLQAQLFNIELPDIIANPSTDLFIPQGTDPTDDFNDWMKEVALRASAFLTFDLKSASSNLNQMADSMSKTYNPGARQIIATLYANFSPAILDTIVNVSLRPWLSAYFIDQFSTGAQFNVHTQAYAFKTLIDTTIRALTKMLATYSDQTVSDAKGLQAIVTALGNVLPTSTLNIDAQAQHVLTEAAHNRLASQKLASVNGTMVTRLNRSLDLQVRFQVLDTEMQQQRRVMNMWIIALISVLVASTLLIIADRLTAFMLLAGGAFTIVTAALVLPALYLFAKRRTNTV